MRILSRFFALALLTGLLISPAMQAATRIYLQIGPPPIIVEHQSARPHTNYVWQPGYHRWTGHAYAWTNGTWARPPYRNARWIPGEWVHEKRGHYWQAGHWTR
jgi:WXXGXW repeat (2 copies)